MEDLILPPLLGAFVIWSLIARYKTINSPAFTKNVQITVFIFASFAVGLCMINTGKTLKIAHVLEQHHSFKTLLFTSPALFPIIFKILQGHSFSTAFNINLDVVLLPLIMFFGLKYFLLPGNNQLFLIIYFVSFTVVLGFMHSVFGGILAAFNVALIIASFLHYHVLSIDLSSVFDILEQIGIASPLFKWMIVIASTLAGIHGSLNSQWLGELGR